jgi:hypothetical protein
VVGIAVEERLVCRFEEMLVCHFEEMPVCHLEEMPAYNFQLVLVLALQKPDVLSMLVISVISGVFAA